MKVVFVVPVYNEHDTLEALVAGISLVACTFPHRILLVDDGSTDGSWAELLALRKRFPAMDLIKFRRNFGKTQALAVAFARSDADIVVTMDADLQDNPEEIPALLAKLNEGFDLVCGWKEKRQDPWHKTFPSRVYNTLVARVFGLKTHDINTGFKAMRMEVAKRLPLYSDMHRMIVVFAAHMGYRVTEVPVVHLPRRFGKSKYGMKRFFYGIRDAAIVWLVIHHLARPQAPVPAEECIEEEHITPHSPGKPRLAPAPLPRSARSLRVLARASRKSFRP